MSNNARECSVRTIECCMKLGVSCFLPQARCFLFQDTRGVCFAKEYLESGEMKTGHKKEAIGSVKTGDTYESCYLNNSVRNAA